LLGGLELAGLEGWSGEPLAVEPEDLLDQGWIKRAIGGGEEPGDPVCFLAQLGIGLLIGCAGEVGHDQEDEQRPDDQSNEEQPPLKFVVHRRPV
jgi:hypothetical protein